MDKLHSKVVMGKRKRSNSCRSSSQEATKSHKMPKFENAKLSKERFSKRRKSQTLFCRRRRNVNGQSFKFFYGGSIGDPLNLNGLINRTELSNSVTPSASPMITPLRGDMLLPIFRCPNIRDPLNLGGECPNDLLNVKQKQRRKRRYSYKKQSKTKESINCGNGLQDDDASPTNASTRTESIDGSKPSLECGHANETLDRNASLLSDAEPVINTSSLSDQQPEAGASKTKSRNRRSKQAAVIKHKTKNTLFRFGNYSSYVGYCNLNNCDARVDLLAGENLQNKVVLDVGCNVGNVTIKIAKDLQPRRVEGIDIDPHLVHVAKKNLSYFSNLESTYQRCQPNSMKTFYGPLAYHPLLEVSDEASLGKFPLNIEFRVENYVPLSDFEARKQKPQFDVIVAFGMTKYIHLNYGDEGLKRTFVKMFNHLKPGGKLFMQAQDWKSYKGKKKLSEEIFNTYKNIKFFPPQFEDFLLSCEVGFSNCQHVADIQLYNRPRGTNQSILKFVKAAEEGISKHKAGVEKFE